MNHLRGLFTMPWVASPAYSRWIVAAMLVIAVPMGLDFIDDAIVLTWIAAVAIWVLWAGYIAGNFQLQREARKLYLPGVARDGDLSLLLFGVLGLAVPIVAAWLLGAPQPFASAMFLTAAIGGLAYVMLPLYLGVPLIAGVFTLLTRHGPTMPVIAWAALIVALLIIDVWRWWQFRNARLTPEEGWNAAAVFYGYRMFAARRGSWTGSFTQTFLQKQLARPTLVDMHRVGPDRPVASLRVALGGLGMPKPLVARLRDAGLLASYVLAFSLVLLLPQAISANQHSMNAVAIRLHWISPLILFVGVFMCIVGVTAFAGRMLATWRKPDAELALLALLPGLGTALQSRSNTLRALLLPATVFLGITAGLLCLGAFDIHAKVWAYVAIALCCAGAFGLSTSITLETLGGHAVRRPAYVASVFALMLLTVFTLSAGFPTDQYRGPHPELVGVPPAWLLVAWALFLVSLGVVAFKGWRDLRKRPHPFLTSAQ